jgi:hypothetical protein
MQDWEKVARVFAGAKPSTELIQVVGELGLDLQSKLASQRKKGPVVDKREPLQKILKAVQSAKGRLNKLDDISRTYLSLRKWLDLAEKTLGSAESAAQSLLNQLPSPKGRGRPRRKGLSSGHEELDELGLLSSATWCAVYVGILWKGERGRWPANNIAFRRVCAALYAEAGGGEIDADPKDGVWREHWREARSKWPKIVWEENGTVRAISTPPTSPAQSAKIKAISYDAELDLSYDGELDLGGDETSYNALIARAVAGLEKNSPENRRTIYERARAALVAQLRGVKPPLNERRITDERLKLESSIRQVEAESVRRSRRNPMAENDQRSYRDPPRWRSAEETPRPQADDPLAELGRLIGLGQRALVWLDKGRKKRK